MAAGGVRRGENPGVDDGLPSFGGGPTVTGIVIRLSVMENYLL